MTHEEEILKKLGNDNTKTVVLRSTNPPIGVYTYRGDVCVLRYGSDFDFDEMDDDEKEMISKKVKSGDYDKNPSFQG